MSDISRRDALRRLGLVLMATGCVDRVAAQEIHQMAGEARRRPAALHAESVAPHAYRTLERLTDLITRSRTAHRAPSPPAPPRGST